MFGQKKLYNKKTGKFVNNDEGVSAVVGTILMVAITVVIAAIVASFVFGMANSSMNAGATSYASYRFDRAATATAGTDQITITCNGMGAIAPSDVYVVYNGGQPALTGDDLSAVGDAATFTTTATGAHSIAVVGTVNGNAVILTEGSI